MKYTIEGFQQSSLVAYGLDVSDTIILRYIVDFYHTGEMYHKIIDMKIYFWVSYKSIISNLPVLNNIQNNERIKNKNIKFFCLPILIYFVILLLFKELQNIFLVTP